MVYNGWNLYDEVTLVIKTNKHRKYGYPQAYVVDTKNKKQYASAISWGTEYSYTQKEDGTYDKFEYKPLVKTLKNDGFTIELIDSADNSCQGGKLSFWNCLIKHDKENIECIVGINADLLLDLLLQNKFVNGKCDNKVIFARRLGNVGVLSKNMKEYKSALDDMQTKKDITKKKTSKWQIGNTYNTLTIQELYLGELYKPFEIGYTHKYSPRDGIHRTVWKLGYDKDPNKKVIINTLSLDDNINKLSEILSLWKNNIDNSCKSIKEKFSKNNKISSVNLYQITSRVGIFNNSELRVLDKFPARQCGEKSIEIDMNLNEFYKEIIEFTQDKVLELIDMGVPLSPYSFDAIILRTEKFNENELTDREKRLLDIIISVDDKYSVTESTIKYHKNKEN